MAKKILQTEIEVLTKEEENLKALRKRVKDSEAKVANAKHELKTRLEDGEKVEKGRYTLSLEKKDGKVTPSWKDLYLNHQQEIHGIAKELAEEEARKQYPAETSIVLVVGISAV